jgi:hypothetical protein
MKKFLLMSVEILRHAQNGKRDVVTLNKVKRGSESR